MPYDPSDPRAQLGATATRSPGASVAAQYFEFPQLEPDEVSAGGTRSWHVRSQSCCLVFSMAKGGDVLSRVDQPDEYMVLLPEPDSAARISAGEDHADVHGAAVVVVPPGNSDVHLERSGIVVRLFSARASDLLARCRNADFYTEPDPNVAPFTPWPDPPAGYRIRVYDLASIAPDPARFGRILRCSTLMVNYFYPDDSPRDASKLSPHHHDDFEQLSLQLAGDYVHHMRAPWTVDMAEWREDEHKACSSPALTIIPPPTVHTSQSVHHMRHQLVDIFCPPRVDFSERPGWVVNADEYPMP